MNKDFKLFANDKGISSLTLHDYGNHISNNYINPSIIEERQMNITQMDVFSKLIQERQIFLGTGIDDVVSNIITAQLLYLDSVDSSDVTILISSGGGIVSGGYSIVDSMDYIACDVATITTSMAASMAAVIASNGTKGKRAILPHGRIMIHQPLGGTQGQAKDMEIALEEMLKIKKELYETLAKNTGKTYEQIEKDCDRDYWLKAQEAVDYGLVDEIIKTKKK
jgi:ATP-dependent Clp protease protease subunit